MPIDFPYGITGDGRTAMTGAAGHVRDLIEQVLFTSPGERVNRPTFGTGLQQLVFAPASEELVTAAEYLVQSALMQWLGDVARVDAVSVQSDGGTLTVAVQYTLLLDRQTRIETFEKQLTAL